MPSAMSTRRSIQFISPLPSTGLYVVTKQGGDPVKYRFYVVWEWGGGQLGREKVPRELWFEDRDETHSLLTYLTMKHM